MSDENEVKVSCNGLLIPIAAGAITNLAGGSIETAALVGAGVASAGPLLATTVATAVGAIQDGKKTACIIGSVGLGLTLLAGGIGAGVSAGSHKVTDLIRDNLSKPAIVEQVQENQN